jgi:hypothetical protein
MLGHITRPEQVYLRLFLKEFIVAFHVRGFLVSAVLGRLLILHFEGKGIFVHQLSA